MSFASSTTTVHSTSTFFLFATALATGIVTMLPFVPLAPVGRRFFILMTLMSVVFIGLGIVDRGLDISYSYLAFAALLVAYNVTLPKQPGADPTPRQRPKEVRVSSLALLVARVLLALAVVCGLAGLIADAVAHREALSLAGSQPFWLSASSVSSALLLGSTLVTMVLGHWYLVARGLSFGPLRRLTLILAGTLSLRLLVAALGAWVQREHWGELAAQAGLTGFLLSHGVFVLPRLLFGLAVPLVLVKMVWGCVQIRSNQSATGILYVVVAFVFIGEILAKHFLVSWGLLL